MVAKHGMIQQIEGCIEQFAGKDVAQKIMEDSENITEKTDKKVDVNAPREKTHEIERLLYRFPEIVERAGKEFAPHYITTYLTELASSFNNFYAYEQIIDGSPESPYRLAIVKAFNIVMKNGLILLGIPAPEKM